MYKFEDYELIDKYLYQEVSLAINEFASSIENHNVYAIVLVFGNYLHNRYLTLRVGTLQRLQEESEKYGFTVEPSNILLTKYSPFVLREVKN